MKNAQLQKSIITDLTKKSPVRWHVGIYEGRAVLTDGYRLHLVSEKDLYINPERMVEANEASMEAILNEHRESDLKELTYISSNREDNYDLFDGDGFEVAVNPKYLKYFEGYELKGSGELKPIYVYELGELVGLVMPTSRKR